MKINKYPIHSNIINLVKVFSIALLFFLGYFILQITVSYFTVDFSLQNEDSIIYGNEKLTYNLIFGIIVVFFSILSIRHEGSYSFHDRHNEQEFVRNFFYIFLHIISFLNLIVFTYYGSDLITDFSFYDDINMFEDIFNNFKLSNLILLVFFVPIYEELFFRRFLLVKILLSSKNVLFSVFCSSLFFGLIHLQYSSSLINVFTSFVFGLFLSFVFIKSRSMIYCIVGHSFYNFCVLFQLDYIFINYLIEGNYIMLKLTMTLFISLLLFLYSFKFFIPKNLNRLTF
jgi:membrane protease YdiL (CAAX protease family)